MNVDHLRVGVAFPGDARRPQAWSGTPSGLVGGLEAHGVEVVALGARLPATVDNKLLAVLSARRTLPLLAQGRRRREDLAPGFAVAATGPAYGAAGSAYLALDLRRAERAGPLDAVIQIGTSYRVGHRRVVTFEDMTVAQAIAAGYPEWTALGPGSRRLRLARQHRTYTRAYRCLGATPWVTASIQTDHGIDAGATAAVGLGRNRTVEPVARDWSRPRLLFLGKEWERKNGERVLKAFRRLRQEVPGARLDLVGRHPRVEADGVTGHGFLSLADPATGPVLTGLLQRATCLVVPSLVEPAGIVYLEAAAAGVASIATTRGGAADLVGDGGLAVEPTDTGALLEAMRALADPAAAQAAGRRALARSGLFTWERVAARVLTCAGLRPHEPADWHGLFPHRS